MKIGVPIVEHFFGQFLGADQTRQPFSGQGEMLAVDLAHQVLAGYRHVLRVAGAQVVVAFIRAGAAFDANVHVHLQRAVAL